MILTILSLKTNADYNGTGDITVGSTGTHNSTYSTKNQGLRFYVVDENGKIVSKVVDITNGNPYSKVTDPYYFNLTTKRGISTKGYYLEPVWDNYFPGMPLPVTSSGSSYQGNGVLIKNYLLKTQSNGLTKLTNFVNTENILGIAGVASDKTPYQVIEENQKEDGSGWRIMIEPVAWIVPRTFNGDKTLLLNGKPCWVYGTYSDFAKSFVSDLKENGNKSTNDYSVVLNNAGPKSMELSKDINFANGSYLKKNIYGSPRRFTYNQLMDISNGLGIHSFKPAFNDGEPGIPSDIYHYEYRTNTEVISSVYVHSTGEISPDDNAYVSFDVGNKTYKKQFVCPENSSQLVWVRWTTPDTPQDVSISLSTTDGTLETNALNCKISDLAENTPPDPTPHDRNDRFIFNIPPVNNIGNKSNTWSEWWAYWEENWEWKSRKCQKSCPDNCSGGHGRWVDNGKWIYEKENYEAKLFVKAELVPADSVKTHYKKGTSWEMKSGYGVEVDVKSNRDYNSTNYDVTDVQNVMSFFPEFKYKTYNRILEKVDNSFVFKHNEYSFVGENCHYTPLWYPDTTKYEVENVAFDMWTPAGQLWGYASDHIFIEGNVYDDYDIVEVSPTDPDFHRYGE